jgi:AraC family transcriptional regulator, regulatory protein of adaptative response / methylated-DNA-[protein]-cysteine methyltransferase
MNTGSSNSPGVTHISPRLAKRFWQATIARDPRADGTFFIAVRSTGVYCRPSCPARRPFRRNVLFFRTQHEAELHGFRACRRCRPDKTSASAALVDRALRLLRDSATEDGSPRLERIAAQLGVSAGILRRAFAQVTGLTPRDLAAAFRVHSFKKLLRQGKGISHALYETGYGSSSRVYERSNMQLGMTPAIYRKGGKGMKIGYTVAKSSLGKILVGATERGISAVYLGEGSGKLAAELRAEYPRAQISRDRGHFELWVREVVRRAEGQAPARALPLDLQATAFQRRVWQELQNIPRGSTRTYTQIARSLGRPRAVRAVARACATNPVSIVVPCHRVVRMDGNLAGYRWGVVRKQILLQKEKGKSSRKSAA